MGRKRIRQVVLDGRYELTIHALEEMDEDGLREDDVHRTLLHGRVVAELTDDPRGPRFVIRRQVKGQGSTVEVVCRFLPSGALRIITVYLVEE